MLKKNILLGITGGIAAYKAAIIVRLLIKLGCNVKVVLSEKAKHFITPLTLATLSKNPILVDFFDPENGSWNSHVDLGLWADAYIIAPATANSLSKMALGVADNLLLTTYLSARCPVFFAPTMDLDMYKHPATQKNINTLIERGNICIEAQSGELASGLEGKGRMAEPDTIVRKITDFFEAKLDFLNKNVLITAGPTYEHIDPVRFIGNYSSGKMGFAIAQEFANRGANVTLVSGPVNISTINNNINRIDVTSANEMYEQAEKHFHNANIAVFAAAVADYMPVIQADEKIKKSSENFTLQLKKTPDIAKLLGEIKRNDQINVGFALETNDEVVNAKEKLIKKNFDFVVLNSLKDEGAGFNHDTNKITIISNNAKPIMYPLKSKQQVAVDIVNNIFKKITSIQNGQK
ncbi:MAG: bifunctional phosphopantothenoylcysteine decarboxylase/phosphopantothenate--cysteine ligase CoaBC [Bacteroidales bacterium]|nr:bifunctional phosphopantothenoylcysteine decarboxylase/phosphopantothenate--cysteine ligase CoaBC [Bacteroidales bacterium]